MSDTKTNQSAAQRWFWGPVSTLGLSVMLITTLIDQGHKWWMLLVYDIEAKKRVAVTPFLNLVYAKNTGVSYGMLSGVSQTALFIFAIVVIIAMAIWLAMNSSRLIGWSMGLIMGGALGNAIDRLTMGGVADFFQLHAFGYSWYIFNIADMAIVAGVIGLLYDSFWVSRNDAAKSN